MKQILKKHKLHVAMAIMMVALFAASCVYIDGYNIAQTDENGKEVYYAYAGQEATFTLRGHVESRQTGSDGITTNLVFGILVPKDWDLANNAVVTYKNDLADDPTEEMSMVLVPSSSLPKQGNGKTWAQCLQAEYGVGPNVLDDMEWVVYQTSDKWTILNNEDPTYTVIVRTKVGQKNLKCKLGFFINHTDDGFGGGTDHKKVTFASECFEVVGGTGMTIDFCNNHYNKVSPMTVLQDDYVTISYIGDVASNDLNEAESIYLQGEAVTTAGKIYKVDVRNSKTQMKRQDEISKNFTKTIWPVGFFEVPTDETIDYITYYFSNADGTITITQDDDDYVQLGEELEDPNNKEPFRFSFSCE